MVKHQNEKKRSSTANITNPGFNHPQTLATIGHGEGLDQSPHQICVERWPSTFWAPETGSIEGGVSTARRGCGFTSCLHPVDGASLVDGAGRFQTCHGPVPVHGPRVGDPCARGHIDIKCQLKRSLLPRESNMKQSMELY